MADAYELRVIKCKLFREEYPLWLLAIFEVGQDLGTFYYAPLALSVSGSAGYPKPKVETRTKPSAENILCNELIKTITRPHMDGPKGFNKIIAGISKRENVGYVIDALFQLERCFIVPDGTWALWRTKLDIGLGSVWSSRGSLTRGFSLEPSSSPPLRALPPSFEPPTNSPPSLSASGGKSRKQAPFSTSPSRIPKGPSPSKKPQLQYYGSLDLSKGQASPQTTRSQTRSPKVSGGQSSSAALASPSGPASRAIPSSSSKIPSGNEVQLGPFSLPDTSITKEAGEKFDFAMHRSDRYTDLQGRYRETIDEEGGEPQEHTQRRGQGQSQGRDQRQGRDQIQGQNQSRSQDEASGGRSQGRTKAWYGGTP